MTPTRFAAILLALAVTLAWACGGKPGRPNLPPPEYEEPASPGPVSPGDAGSER